MPEGPDDKRFMDFLLFRSLKGEQTPAEQEKVSEWRAAAPENEEHYRRLGRLLELTADVHRRPRGELDAPPDAVDLLRPRQGRAPRRRRWLLPVAALGALG